MLGFADGLSLLGLTWSLLQATSTARQPPATTTGLARIDSLVLLLRLLFCRHFMSGRPRFVYQVVAFVGAIVLIGLRSHFLSSPSVNERHGWNRMTLQAALISLFGYALWNIDLKYCVELRDQAAGWLAMGLALWVPWLVHAFTGTSASLYMDRRGERNPIGDRPTYAEVKPRVRC